MVFISYKKQKPKTEAKSNKHAARKNITALSLPKNVECTLERYAKYISCMVFIKTTFVTGAIIIVYSVRLALTFASKIHKRNKEYYHRETMKKKDTKLLVQAGSHIIPHHHRYSYYYL